MRRPPPAVWTRPRSRFDLVPAEDLATEPDQRVVPLVDDALLHRDDRVVGDLDVLRAHLGAALGDVAVPDALLLDRELLAVTLGVQRVHVQLGGPDEEPGAGEGGL